MVWVGRMLGEGVEGGGVVVVYRSIRRCVGSIAKSAHHYTRDDSHNLKKERRAFISCHSNLNSKFCFCICI